MFGLVLHIGEDAIMESNGRAAEIEVSLEEFRQRVQQNPADIQNHLQLGWAAYGEGLYGEAMQVLQTARDRFQDDLEILYPLGLTMKKVGKKDAALKIFRHIIDLTDRLEDRTKAAMLRRLAIGHINVIETGAWNLKQQTWEWQ